jgi:hypothetical protein
VLEFWFCKFIIFWNFNLLHREESSGDEATRQWCIAFFSLGYWRGRWFMQVQERTWIAL